MEEVGASQAESWDRQLRRARFLREAEGDQARASTPRPQASQSEKPSASWAHGAGGPGEVTRGVPTEAGAWALRGGGPAPGLSLRGPRSAGGQDVRPAPWPAAAPGHQLMVTFPLVLPPTCSAPWPVGPAETQQENR